MGSRPIMDAGPGLNFFSLNKERLLFSVLGALCVPETVENEILRKARQDPRFSAAQTVWNKLPSTLMEILPDDATDELAAAVSRIADIPFQQRVKKGQDLGETMVIAHAVVAAEAGADVTILIDEREGTQIAAREQQRLKRLQAAGNHVGSISLVNTITVLKIAVRKNAFQASPSCEIFTTNYEGLIMGYHLLATQACCPRNSGRQGARTDVA